MFARNQAYDFGVWGSGALKQPASTTAPMPSLTLLPKPQKLELGILLTIQRPDSSKRENVFAVLRKAWKPTQPNDERRVQVRTKWMLELSVNGQPLILNREDLVQLRKTARENIKRAGKKVLKFPVDETPLAS